MLSHDLAKALLSRRNNDVAIEVYLNIKGDEPYRLTIPLRDSKDEDPGIRLPSHMLLSYSNLLDRIVIKAGEITFGYTDEDFN